MIFDKYILPLYSPEDGSGATPPLPAEPPANPTDPNPEALGATDEWVLGHFDGLQADDASEDIDSNPVEPTPAAPVQVSAQAENPEGALPPSQQTGNVPQVSAALATPAPISVAPTPPVPVVGASANQTVSPAPLAQTSAPDPTSIMAQIARGIQERKAEFIETLSARYLIPEKEADDLGISPEMNKHLARQHARAQVEATASITQMQSEQLPVQLNGMLEARTNSLREEERFFSQFPGLKDAPKAKLAKIFESVSSMHPELKGDDWKKKAGEIAHVSLGIPIQVQSAANGQVGQQQAIRTPGPIVRQTNGLAHSPVGTSTTPAPLAPQLTEAERFFRLLQQTDAGDFDQN